jgi:hypothetical protein
LIVTVRSVALTVETVPVTVTAPPSAPWGEAAASPAVIRNTARASPIGARSAVRLRLREDMVTPLYRIVCTYRSPQSSAGESKTVSPRLRIPSRH